MRPVHRPGVRVLCCVLALIITSTLVAKPLTLDADTTKPATRIKDYIAKPATTPAVQKDDPQIKANYGHLPLSFEANNGQTAGNVKFLSRGKNQNLFLTSTEAILTLSNDDQDASKLHSQNQIRLGLINANSNPIVEGLDQLEGRINYFIGNDPAKWHKNIPTFGKVKYRNVYRGIDMIYYGQKDQLEFDYIVAAGANPGDIQFAISGTDNVDIDKNGNLVLETDGTRARLERPVIYQGDGGSRRQVGGRYVIQNTKPAESGAAVISFQIDSYDHSRPLIIDPLLVYSDLIGGSSGAQGNGIAVDASGNTYITGTTRSIDFPLNHPTQGSGGFSDVFVSKLNSNGTELIYSTFIGGNGDDFGNGIAIDAAGNAYVTGATQSSTFPTTVGAFQRTMADGQDAFVLKLRKDGAALLYSTYLGGLSSNIFGDGGNGIAVDSSGNAFVTGVANSFNFPTTQNALQKTPGSSADAFITKLNSTGSGLIYSTYLGGNSDDVGRSIAIDQAGNACITGMTLSTNLPTLNPFQPNYGGTTQDSTSGVAGDAFIAKVNTDASALIYSSYLGGSRVDNGFAVAMDSTGNAYVTGLTFSSNFPVTLGTLKTSNSTNRREGFVSKIDTAGNLLYSTYLGAQLDTEGHGIVVDADGFAYVTGLAGSDFPQVRPAQLQFGGFASDAFVAKINPTGTAFGYSTFVGGTRNETGNAITLDSAGNAYITGTTFSTDFPHTAIFNGASGPQIQANGSSFVTKIGIGLNAISNTLTVSNIVPIAGGDTGAITVQINGTLIDANSTVKLARAGQSDIIGIVNSVTMNNGIASMSATFDLRGHERGDWDVIVINPDSTMATLPGGFTIEAGRAPDMWIDTVGPLFLRVSQQNRYNILVGNRGNTDAFGVIITIRFPKILSFKLPQLQRITSIPNVGLVDFSQAPIAVQTDTETIIPLFLTRVSPTNPLVIPLDLTAPDDPQFAHFGLSIDTQVGRPLYRLTNNSPGPNSSAKGFHPLDGNCGMSLGIDPDAINCLISLVNVVLTAIGLGSFNCATQILLFAEQSAGSIAGLICSGPGTSLAGNDLPTARPLIDIALNLAGNALSFITNCVSADALAKAIGELAALAVPGIGQALTLIQLTVAAIDAIDACLPLIKKKRPAEIITSHDPNDKTGSLGIGSSNFITGLEPLRYSIEFENESTASAAAQSVVVTDQLDPNKVDLSTFSFGDITFGTRRQAIPAGMKDFTFEVDLRPSHNLIVRVNAHLDMNTGLVTWDFKSLDPVTGQPTTDAVAGFLPPNVHSPDGQGSLFYTVIPKVGLQSGTAITNKATVVFDRNPAIDTPEWVNKIDNTIPTSHVLALPANENSKNFLVRWSGSDQDSGIGSFNIFVSQDGGPFTVWLIDTTATSNVFHGDANKTYGFYSIARDLTGNLENSKNAAEATTKAGSTIVVSGDLNNDGVVNVQDLFLLANYLAGNIQVDLLAADVQADGKVDVSDLFVLANYLAGNIHSLPVIPTPAAPPVTVISGIPVKKTQSITVTPKSVDRKSSVKQTVIASPPAVRYQEVDKPPCKCKLPR